MRIHKIIAVLLVALLLAGCAPQTAKLPDDWDANWTCLGSFLGIEPMDGFSVNENKDALAVSGIYYATWTTGAGRDFTNDEGENALVYDAQIYVLLQQCATEAAAKTQIGAWIAKEGQAYRVGEESSLVCGDQSFRVLPLLESREGNPYGKGIAAFAHRGNMAICVEFLCADTYSADVLQVLETFLSGFHYNDPEET